MMRSLQKILDLIDPLAFFVLIYLSYKYFLDTLNWKEILFLWISTAVIFMNGMLECFPRLFGLQEENGTE